ncbi:MAG: glycogen/starch synthase, partial [Clostridia bacterium]
MAEEVKKKSLEKTNPTLKATGSKTAKDATEKKKTTTAKKAPAVKKAVKTETKPVAKTAVAVEKVETLVKKEKPTLVVERKKIMFVASEALPFVASGGLGEVIGSLPKALANNPNYDIRVVMPLYSIIPEKFKREFQYIGNTQITMAWRSQYCGVFKYVFNGVTFYFLDNEYYFKRSGIYGYLDEAERYTFMSKAALDIIPMIGFIPQIIHCHDWQSALIPVYLKTNYKNIDMYKNIRTVFTIHNMEYQGR